jgi:hypothetical protein
MRIKMTNTLNNRAKLAVDDLHEIHDCIALALDASERPGGYTQSETEARSYLTIAIEQTKALMSGTIGGAA